MSSRLQLRDDVAIEVAYRDTTRWGSPVTQGPATAARHVFAPLVAHLEAHGWASLVESSSALLDEVRRSAVFAEVADQASAPEAWVLRDELLHPDPEDALPEQLTLRRPDGAGGPDIVVEAPVGMAEWPVLHDLLSGFASAHGLDASAVPPRFRAYVAALEEHQLVGPPAEAEPDGNGITFVGHNTVVVRSAEHAVVTDPYLVTAVTDRPDYRPVPRRLLGDVDAILLTHSHPDHFDPASILRFDPATPIVVPVVECESILAADMARRLGELGCTDVRPLAWWEATTVGALVVTALPFYGEQPGDGPVLHPEVRNAGNTYVVDTGQPGGRVAFLADAGRDHLGDVRDVARRVAAIAPVDLVFSGYRAWDSHPAQLLLSSVAHFLYFVPPEQWTVRQQLMNGPAEAVEAAEGFGARWLVPYADGGAPWYWERGLGPVLDGTGEERPGFDPFPERVRDAAASSDVEVLLLRPGDGLQLDGRAAPERRRRAGYAWPYGE